MGWWWDSGASSARSSPNVNETLESPATKSPIASSVQQSPQPRTLTSDEQADADFQELMREFQSSESMREEPSKSHASTSTITDPGRTSHSTIHPNNLQPTTMSCKDAFDYAFFCQSIGGQWVNVYRYGELRSCSEHWDNFWLCMRSRSYPKTEREKVIQEHYRKKQVKYRTRPSSEDVWDMRLEPLAEVPFNGDLRKAEMEARQRKDTADRPPQAR